MKKSFLTLISLGSILIINSAQAIPVISQCPSTFSKGDLMKILETPSNTSVNLGDAIWTVGAHSEVDFSQAIVVQELPERKVGGRLECAYHLFVGPVANPQQTLILSKNSEMVKHPF